MAATADVSQQQQQKELSDALRSIESQVPLLSVAVDHEISSLLNKLIFGEVSASIAALRGREATEHRVRHCVKCFAHQYKNSIAAAVPGSSNTEALVSKIVEDILTAGLVPSYVELQFCVVLYLRCAYFMNKDQDTRRLLLSHARIAATVARLAYNDTQSPLGPILEVCRWSMQREGSGGVAVGETQGVHAYLQDAIRDMSENPKQNGSWLDLFRTLEKAVGNAISI